METNTTMGSSQIKKLKSTKDLFVNSCKIYFTGFRQFFGLALVPVICKIILVLLVFASVPLSLILNENSTLLTLITAIGFIAYIIITIGYIYLSLAAEVGAFLLLKNFSKERKIFDILRESFPYIGKFLWLSLFTSGLILLWGVLLIIPGIIFAVYYSFSLWIFIFENKTGMDAVKRSQELVEGRWWAVFFRYFVFFLGILVVYWILDSFSTPFGILKNNIIISGIWQFVILALQFLIVPLPVIYSYFLYKDLGGNTENVVQNSIEIKPMNTKLKKIFLVLATIILIIIISGAFFTAKFYFKFNEMNSIIDKELNNLQISTSSDSNLNNNASTTNPINETVDQAKIKSRDSKRISDIKQIQTALELYLLDKEKYPDNLSPLVSEYQVTDIKDPSGIDYKYTKTADDNYKLCFMLEQDIDSYKKGENCFDKDSQ